MYEDIIATENIRIDNKYRDTFDEVDEVIMRECKETKPL